MAYCNEDDVTSLFRKLELGTNTVITCDKLAAWISQQDAYINGRLSSYYVTPITGSISLKILKLISSYKVAHMVKTVLELTTQNSDKNQEVQTNLDKQAEKMLNDLLPVYGANGSFKEPVLKLPDADVISRSPESAGLISMQQQTGTFKKGGSNW